MARPYASACTGTSLQGTFIDAGRRLQELTVMELDGHPTASVGAAKSKRAPTQAEPAPKHHSVYCVE